MNIRENKGITLIMLIVTIVVILILASVSISAITGGEGIIEKGKQAKDETEIAAEMEELQKIINQSAAKGIMHGNYSGSADATTIRDALKKNNLIVENPDDVIIDGKKGWTVTGIKTGQKYEIKSNGIVEKRGLLPEDFQQVEYIESTGTQYIDTKFTNNSPQAGYYAKYQNSKNHSGDDAVMGVLNPNRCIHTAYLNAGVIFKNSGIGGDNSPKILISKDDIVESYMNFKNNSMRQIKLNGEMKIQSEISGVTTTNSSSCYIFGTHYGNSVWGRTDGLRVFECAISLDNEIVHNYIPCYNKSTNITGLYDTVEEKFYLNAGTGEFIRGPEVN